MGNPTMTLDEFHLRERSIAIALLRGEIEKALRQPGVRDVATDLIQVLDREQESIKALLASAVATPQPEPASRKVTTKTPIPSDLRWAVWERDNFTCHYCGARRDLACDHIVPESQGGPTTLENLITACKPCNSKKGARSYETFIQIMLRYGND